MGILNFLTKNDDQDLEDLKVQARVQCNVPCQILREDSGEEHTSRLREFNWYGLVTDQIPPDFIIDEDSGEGTYPKLKLKFDIPREFGQLDLISNEYVIHRYQDVIADDERLSLSFSLNESENLEYIRNYILYRNKSFIRSEKRKNKRSKTSFLIYFLWGSVATLATFYGLRWILLP
mgnify:CR=1 FL=1|jgi:hypothetical protein